MDATLATGAAGKPLSVKPGSFSVMEIFLKGAVSRLSSSVPRHRINYYVSQALYQT